MQSLTEHDSLVCKRTIRVDCLNRTLDWAVKCCGKNSFHDKYYEIWGSFQSIGFQQTMQARKEGVAGRRALLLVDDERRDMKSRNADQMPFIRVAWLFVNETRLDDS